MVLVSGALKNRTQANSAAVAEYVLMVDFVKYVMCSTTGKICNGVWIAGSGQHAVARHATRRKNSARMYAIVVVKRVCAGVVKRAVSVNKASRNRRERNAAVVAKYVLEIDSVMLAMFLMIGLSCSGVLSARLE